MQRQRGEWVPIAEAFSDMSGPVAALRDASPQARHHFTQADQVNQLVSASEADPDLGFMARLMALCSLPRTNPGDRIRYKRVNGPYTLYMTAGGGCKLPYGNLPRLLLAWLSTEAVRTQSRELVLGKSLSDFMRTLGIYNSGGNPQTRLRNQMKRLFIIHNQPPLPPHPGRAIMPDRSLTYSRAGAPPGPSKPAWFHRLDEILTTLRSIESTLLDRARRHRSACRLSRSGRRRGPDGQAV